jgi:hypothetical protein
VAPAPSPKASSSHSLCCCALRLTLCAKDVVCRFVCLFGGKLLWSRFRSVRVLVTSGYCQLICGRKHWGAMTLTVRAAIGSDVRHRARRNILRRRNRPHKAPPPCIGGYATPPKRSVPISPQQRLRRDQGRLLPSEQARHAKAQARCARQRAWVYLPTALAGGRSGSSLPGVGTP